MNRLLGLVTVLVLALGVSAVPAGAGASVWEPHPAAKRKAPSRTQWLTDVRTAMLGSAGYARQRVAAKASDEQLAVNFDIDNTVIATYYNGGGAIPRMLRFAKLLDKLGVAVVFNTGRVASQHDRTVAQLTRSGFPVDAVCLRAKGATLPVGKQTCRDRFIEEGYTLIANVGNNNTDFVGDGYERAFKLPNYGVLG